MAWHDRQCFRLYLSHFPLPSLTNTHLLPLLRLPTNTAGLPRARRAPGPRPLEQGLLPLGLGLGLLVDLDEPVLLDEPFLAGALAVREPPAPVVAPRALPLAGRLVELAAPRRPLLPRLRLDPLPRRELLPPRRLLRRRQRLLPRQRRRGPR